VLAGEARILASDAVVASSSEPPQKGIEERLSPDGTFLSYRTLY